MPSHTMPADHKPTPAELEVRKVLENELYDHPDVDTNSLAFRIMVVLGEVLPASPYLHWINPRTKEIGVG